MKSSFQDTDTVTDNAQPTTDAAITPTAPQAMVPDSFFANDEMVGDFDRKDIQIPRFNLSQSVGPLSEHFPAGKFIYNRETDLGSGPVEITLLRLEKYFLQDLPYGSEQIPKRLNTAEQVRAEGAFPSWEKKEMGEGHEYYKPVLDCNVLIKGTPENDTFPFEFNGTPYALAVWTIQSVAYSRAGKAFITAATLGLRNGLATGFWSVVAKREKVGVNFIFLPIVRQAGKNAPEFVTWAKGLLGGPSATE